MWYQLICVFTTISCFFFALVLYLNYFSRKQTINNDSLSVEHKKSFIQKITPASHAKGWTLFTVDNGLRVWKKDMKDSWYSGIVYGCSGVIPASLQKIMGSLQHLRCITVWDPCFREVSLVTVSTNHDVVSVPPAHLGPVENSIVKLLHLFGIDTNTIYSRYWSSNDGWFFTSSMEQGYVNSGFLWCGIIILPVAKDESDKPECLVSMVTAPKFPGMSLHAKMLTSARLAGLKDFFTDPTVSMNKTLCVSNDEVVVKSSAENLFKAQDTKNSGTPENTLSMNEQQVGEFTQGFISDNNKKIANNDRINEILEVSMKAYNGEIGTDGWSLIGTIKNVEISKRISQPGERPIDTLKGAGLVTVPIHYVLAYVFGLKYRGEWDDMFLKGEILKHLDGLTRIVWMEYKAVWPTTGRDFVNLVALREVEEGLFVVAAASIEERSCPPKKGLVRGELMCAALFVREVSSDPPCCQVTYISRADLKGNLPPRLVNRVTQSQPQAIAVLREKLEAMYNDDKVQTKDKKKMSDLQKEGGDLWEELIKIRENGQQGTPQIEDLEKVMSEGALDRRSTAEEKSLQEFSIENKQTAEESSVELNGAQINEENMELPFVDRYQIDYKTLGNQSAATLIGEVTMASKAEIAASEDPIQQSRKEGEWCYQGMERDVVILRKINPGEKIHSFLGKGVIKCNPIIVWNAVKNHMTRHIYDKTLKKTKIIKQLDESLKLLYLHHETSQCFTKQARDFVVLAVERTEPQRYVFAGVSVNAPESPPVKELIRGKIYASGWVIEPFLQDGHLRSMVSYLSQVDFGGAVPARLINYIAKRQPLCVSYLREYLEKFKE